MKQKIYIVILITIVTRTASLAQTVTDFTKKECGTGKVYNLFNLLDSNKVAILEFFHTCATCSQAAVTIKPMYQKLISDYGKKVNFFVMPEDNAYDCTQVLGWVSANGLSSVVTPLDSGGVQCAYYGGMAMPTIAVVAGKNHKILYLCNPNTASFATGDTAKINYSIRHFLDSTFAGVPFIKANVATSISPNPVTDNIFINVETKESGKLKLELLTISGQIVSELTEEKIQSGIWSRNFPVSIANGTYFIKGTFNEKNTFYEKVTVLH